MLKEALFSSTILSRATAGVPHQQMGEPIASLDYSSLDRLTVISVREVLTGRLIFFIQSYRTLSCDGWGSNPWHEALALVLNQIIRSPWLIMHVAYRFLLCQNWYQRFDKNIHWFKLHFTHFSRDGAKTFVHIETYEQHCEHIGYVCLQDLLLLRFKILKGIESNSQIWLTFWSIFGTSYHF